MKNIQDSAVAPNPPAAFPLPRPGQLTRALFKAGAGAYRGPLARPRDAPAHHHGTRRSRLPRRTALTFRDLGGSYLVLAGMGAGSDWYRNLLAQPRVRVRIGAQTFPATAEPVLDPEQRRMLAPRIATQWDRHGPPRAMRWMLRRFARFDYDAELAHALAHAEDMSMVDLVPRGPHRDQKERGRI